MKLVVSLALFAAFAFALYGWGWAARRLLRARSTGWAATVACGMAAVVFIGGWLNLARLAYAWSLACVAVAGAGLGIAALAKDRRKFPKPAWALLPLVPAAAVLAFAVATQVPPKAFNFHDDYQKYFVHVTRMLETGTVFGSRYSVIGLDTMGAQAFLQGFAAALFPIRYINAIDAAFALFLCMMLAAAFTRGRRELLPMAVLCSVAVALINPQYVNVSALYTGSLLILAVMEEDGLNPWVTGLLYAGLIALKSSLALFPLAHLAAALWTRGLRWSVTTAAGLAAFLSPWVLLHAPHYSAIFGGSTAPANTGVRALDTFDIFSLQPLDFGATAANYTWLMLVVGLCGGIIMLARRRRDLTAAACFASIAAYLFAIYVSGPRVAGYQHAIRYFAPFAIGIAPAAFGSAAVALVDVKGLLWLRVALPLFAAAAPIAAFTPSFLDRASQAIHSGSVLAFSWLAPDTDYLAYSRQVLDGDARRRVQAAQAKTPPDQAVMAWINAPFYLDYRRNPIEDVEPSEGFVAPWSRMSGGHYFIWEYMSYANIDEADYAEEMTEGPDLMRRAWTARVKLALQMNELLQHGEKLYDDGGIVVFRD